MRLGVLDVGSNTVHFLVVDAHQGGRPLPVFSHKAELHLGDSLENGKLPRSVAMRLRGFVSEALQIAEDKGVEELLAFATSAVRTRPTGTTSSPRSGPPPASTSRCCRARKKRG